MFVHIVWIVFIFFSPLLSFLYTIKWKKILLGCYYVSIEFCEEEKVPRKENHLSFFIRSITVGSTNLLANSCLRSRPVHVHIRKVPGWMGWLLGRNEKDERKVPTQQKGFELRFPTTIFILRDTTATAVLLLQLLYHKTNNHQKASTVYKRHSVVVITQQQHI